MIQADYDNDGFVDVLILRGGWMGSEGRFPLSLLRNNGDGTFTDVTVAAGLLRPRAHPDRGLVRLRRRRLARPLRGQRDRPARAEDPHPCELFHNNGDGTFTNVAHESGVDVVGFVKGVVSGDYDNDGRPDLYVSVQGGDNILFRNDGPAGDGRGWRFTNVADGGRRDRAGGQLRRLLLRLRQRRLARPVRRRLRALRRPARSRGTWPPTTWACPRPPRAGRLYHNRGDGTFEDVTKAAGLYKVVPAMGLNFGDLDNDGWLDFYLGTGNPDFGTLDPQPDVPQRRGPHASRTSPPPATSATCRRGTRSLRRRRQRRRPGRLRGDGRRLPRGQGL